MIFQVSRAIEDRVFVSTISFKAYGGEEITAKEELEQFGRYGYPQINAGGTFTAGVSEVDGKIVISDDKDAGTVIVITNNDYKLVRDDFIVELRINLNSIQTSPEGNISSDKLKIAEARCLVFEEEIKKRLKEALEAIRLKQSSFSLDFPKDFTI